MTADCADATDTIRDLFNDLTHRGWKDVRDFLAIHYKFNTMLDTPFWKQAQEDTDVSGVAELIKFYQENGPTGFCRYRLPNTQTDFGLEGFLVMFVGNKVPYKNRYKPTEQELKIWNDRKAGFVQEASRGIRSEEALAYVHHPGWKWNSDA